PPRWLCGLEATRLHDWRAMMSTELIERGVPGLVVSARLGHAQNSTTAMTLGSQSELDRGGPNGWLSAAEGSATPRHRQGRSRSSRRLSPSPLPTLPGRAVIGAMALWRQVAPRQHGPRPSRWRSAVAQAEIVSVVGT